MSQGVLVLWLMALWPFANFIHYNQKILRFDEIGLILLVYFILVLLVSVILHVFFRLINIKRKAPWYALSGTALLLFFSYEGLALMMHRLIEAYPTIPWGINHLYAALCLFTLCAIGILACKARHAATILTFFAATAVTMPVMSFLWFTLSTSENQISTSSQSDPSRFSQRPNIYYLVTDEYARQDQMLHITGYDNSEFNAWLEQQGFKVSKSSWTNYPVTFLSLASSLGMSYPYTDGEAVPSRQPAHRIIGGDNPVVKRLRKNGYYYFHAPAVVWNGSRCSGREDACLRKPVGINNEVISNMLRMSPLMKVVQKYTKNGIYVATLEHMLEHLDKVKENTPYFVFFHSLPPHPPHIFHPDCSLKMADDMRLMDTITPGELGETTESYIDNVRCVNKQLHSTIAYINKEDPEAIVVIHADHGTGFKTDWKLDPRRWTKEQLTERFAIQMAMRLPDKCQNLSYEGISPINIFEAVFACLEERPAEFKEDVSYGFLYELPENEGQLVHKVNLLQTISETAQ